MNVANCPSRMWHQGRQSQRRHRPPIFQAWIESLGAGGAERVTKAAQLMDEMDTLESKAWTAMEGNATGELDGLNRRAKVLAARAEVLALTG